MTPEGYAAACERAAAHTESWLDEQPIWEQGDTIELAGGDAATLRALAVALRGAATITTQVDALTMRYELPPPVFDTTPLYGITLP